MDYITKLLDYWTALISTANWYVVGGLVGSMLATIGITAWVKRHHLKQTAEKLASEFIVLNVAFWGFISAIATFVITQGTHFATMLPFVSRYWPTISASAIATHAIATGLHKWWTDRKEHKPILDINTDGIIDTPKTPEPLKPIPAISQDVWK